MISSPKRKIFKKDYGDEGPLSYSDEDEGPRFLKNVNGPCMNPTTPFCLVQIELDN